MYFQQKCNWINFQQKGEILRGSGFPLMLYNLFSSVSFCDKDCQFLFLAKGGEQWESSFLFKVMSKSLNLSQQECLICICTYFWENSFLFKVMSNLSQQECLICMYVLICVCIYKVYKYKGSSWILFKTDSLKCHEYYKTACYKTASL